MSAIWTESPRNEHSVRKSITHLWEMFAPGSASDASLLATIGDEDIDGLENKFLEISRRMRTLKNARLPIMRLPADILCIVFRMMQIACVKEVAPSYLSLCHDQSSIPPPISMKWIYATHVCSHWRGIALSYPSLWTHVSTISDLIEGDYYRACPLSLLKALLKRSGDAPINMQVQLGAVRSDVLMTRTINILLPHLPRCRELHLFCPPQVLLASLDGMQIPQLRMLTVCTLYGEDDDLELPFIDSSPINYLTLFGCGLFTKYSFGNLKQLRIYQDFNNLDKMRSFLDVLETNHSLEDILFQEIPSPSPREDEEPGSQAHAFSRHIRMPNLRTMAFLGACLDGREDFNLCCYLLTHIVLPPQLALTVRVDSGYNRVLNHVFSCAALHRSLINDISTVSIVLNDGLCWDVLCISSSSAWIVENCELGPGASLNHPAVLHSARQLWLSSLLLSTNEGNGEIPALWAWLGTHHFEEVVLTLGLGDGDGDGDDYNDGHGHDRDSAASQHIITWFFEPFMCDQAVIPYAQVHTLRFHGARSELWEYLLAFAEDRELLGHPIRTLTFVCRRKAPRKEREIFEGWKRRAPLATELGSVEQVEFIDVDEYPQPLLPPICAPRDHGPWTCFDWTSFREF